MDVRDLQYFLAVAELGHLGRAAKTVFRSQPALSKSIDRLEQSLDVKLFDRAGRGIRLTPVGEVLLRRARHVRVTLDDTIREIKGYARGTAGHERIGVAPTVAQYLLPHVLPAFLREAIDVKIDLKIGLQPVLLEALRDGRIDLVIGPLPSRSEQFATQPLIENTVVVVAARSHPILRRRASLSDLLAYGWILPPAAYDNDLRSWLDAVFERRGLPRPKVQLEADSLTLLPEIIAKTELLSFITRWNLGAGRIGASLREVPVKDTTMTRQFGVVHRKDAYLSPAMRRLIAILQRESKRLTPLEAVGSP